MTATVIPFRAPTRAWQCPHCGWWLLPDTEAERWHGATPARCKRRPMRAQDRIDRLRKGLSDPEACERILAATKLNRRQLSRVAAGRSTLASSKWRRVLEACA